MSGLPWKTNKQKESVNAIPTKKKERGGVGKSKHRLFHNQQKFLSDKSYEAFGAFTHL